MRGLSRKDFATQAGIGQSYVSMLCENSRIPNLATAMKIAKVLGVSVEMIWTHED
jgi:transcriptional regulator with XRE-family HTH domain